MTGHPVHDPELLRLEREDTHDYLTELVDASGVPSPGASRKAARPDLPVGAAVPDDPLAAPIKRGGSSGETSPPGLTGIYDALKDASAALNVAIDGLDLEPGTWAQAPRQQAKVALKAARSARRDIGKELPR